MSDEREALAYPPERIWISPYSEENVTCGFWDRINDGAPEYVRADLAARYTEADLHRAYLRGLDAGLLKSGEVDVIKGTAVIL